MRVAVTGGTGFVGGHLVEALRRRGDEVTALVRARPRAEVLERLGCRLVAGQLAEARALESLLDGAEAVYHVAGRVAARSERELLAVNRDGTERLAREAARAGVRRFLHVSSLAVTGPTLPGRPLDESAPPRPVSAYGRSKRAAEEALLSSGVTFTIVRPPAVYGPRDRQFLTLFRLARRGWAPLLGDGRQELTLVHVADVADALIAAATSPATAGRVYHAGHPERVTQRAFAEAVARSLDRRVRVAALPAPLVRALLRLTGAAARLSGRTTLLSPDKAGELLAPAWTCTSEALWRDAGWRAAIPLERGLAETARWYREAGWL